MFAVPAAHLTESAIDIVECGCSDPSCPQSARYVFVWPEKPHTMNQWNLTHHAVRAQQRAHWREAFRLMADGCPPLAWCNVTVDHVVATRRKVDIGAPFPSFKAALDGCVLAGVLDDDSPQFVCSVTFRAPTYEKGRDALIVTLEGPVA